MNYVLLKVVHIGSVATSYALFLLRGIWVLRDSPIMQQRWVKIAPQAVDTTLLAKTLSMLLYIGLGFTAINFGRPSIPLVSWLMAQVVFFYIIAVALTKTVLPWQVLSGASRWRLWKPGR